MNIKLNTKHSSNLYKNIYKNKYSTIILWVFEYEIIKCC